MKTINVSRWPIIQHDPGQVGASLHALPNQLRDGWRQAAVVQLPTKFQIPKSILFAGMGGSHLAADIVKAVFSPTLPVPMEIVSGYHLPAWANTKTLVMCCSYSGNTEETIAILKAAIKRKCLVGVIASGGQLAKMAEQHRLPCWKFSATANVSHQPRLGTGYLLVLLLDGLLKTGMLTPKNVDVQRLALVAKQAVRQYERAGDPKNIAWQVAMALLNKVPLLIGAEWSVGNVHTWSNQIQENAKTYSAWAELPELNHHLLEGLRHRQYARQVQAIMIADATYHQRIQQRLKITAQVFKKQGVKTTEVSFTGKSSLEKAIQLLSFGGYVSWYLAALRKVKPGPVPTVDFLKEQLAKK